MGSGGAGGVATASSELVVKVVDKEATEATTDGLGDIGAFPLT